MEFRQWLESQTLQIPLADIVASRRAVVDAFTNFSNGRESRTNGPAEVWQTEDGHYQLLDGYHRFIAAIVSGRKTLPSEVTEQGRSNYRKVVGPSDRFAYKPSMTYKDLEHLADMELLADLGD